MNSPLRQTLGMLAALAGLIWLGSSFALAEEREVSGVITELKPGAGTSKGKYGRRLLTPWAPFFLVGEGGSSRK